MFQHSPRQQFQLVASGSLPNATLVSITISTNIPGRALMGVSIQGNQTGAASLNWSIIGIGGEESIGGYGPFVYDATTAAHQKLFFWRAPTSGYVPGNQILISAPSAFPTTSYATIFTVVNATQVLTLGQSNNAAGANVVYQSTYALGTGNIVSNAYRNTTLEIVFNTNAAGVAWNGIGSAIITPDGGAGWTSIFNGAATGIGIINLWASFTNRPPLSTAILGRYPSAVNTVAVFVRFGGG